MKNSTRLLILAVLVVIIAAAAVVVSAGGSSDRKTDAPVLSASDEGSTTAMSFFEKLSSYTPAASGTAGPITATLSVNVNRALFPLANSLLANSLPENMKDITEMLEAAANITDNFLLKCIWDGTTVQLETLLKDQELAYGAVRPEGTKIAVESDLLPSNTLLQLPTKDLLRYFGMYYGDEDLTLSFTRDDLRTLEEAAKSMVAKIDNEIAYRTDFEESGNWTFEGTTFTGRRPITTTTKDLGLIIVKAFKDAVESPEVSELLKRFGVDSRSLGLDYTISNLENRSEDDITAEMEGFRYINGNGDTYNDCIFHTYTLHTEYDYETWETVSVTREPSGDVYVRFGTVGPDTLISFSAPQRGGFSLKADSSGASYDASLSIDQFYSGSSLPLSGKILLAGTTSESGDRDGSIKVQVIGMDVVTLNYTVRQGGNITASFDPYGKKVYSEVSEVTTWEFSNLIKTKLLETAAKVSIIMPEEVEKLMPALNLLNIRLY